MQFRVLYSLLTVSWWFLYMGTPRRLLRYFWSCSFLASTWSGCSIESGFFGKRGRAGRLPPRLEANFRFLFFLD